MRDQFYTEPINNFILDTMSKAEQYIIERAEKWLSADYDAETRKKVQELMATNPVELTDAFYRDLEFGTGGLRGIMGVGTNRMNKYTVGMATQGLANYLKKMFCVTLTLLP